MLVLMLGSTEEDTLSAFFNPVFEFENLEYTDTNPKLPTGDQKLKIDEQMMNDPEPQSDFLTATVQGAKTKE